MPAAAKRGGTAIVTWSSVMALGGRNLAEPVLPQRSYVPINLVVGTTLVASALGSGSTWESIGLGRESTGRSLRHGLPIASAAAAVLVFAAAWAPTRDLFSDERVRVDAGIGELVRQLLVRIPVGTVAFEELAFRGVLLDMLLRRRGTGRAVAFDSALFGLWHVVPTLATASANGIDGQRRVGLVAGSVVGTAAAGMAFCALRLRSGHLLAPALLHLACNDTAYALSWWRRSRPVSDPAE